MTAVHADLEAQLGKHGTRFDAAARGPQDLAGGGGIGEPLAMARTASIFLPTLLVALASCGASEQALLTEMPSFSGKVRIEQRLGDHERSLAGELAFDRAAQSLQFTTRGTPTVSLSKLGNNALKVFEDGRPRPVTDADLDTFQLVSSAVHSSPDEAATVRRGDGFYEIQLDTFWTRIELEALPAVHGR
jgi:hypothetical protein